MKYLQSYVRYIIFITVCNIRDIVFKTLKMHALNLPARISTSVEHYWRGGGLLRLEHVQCRHKSVHQGYQHADLGVITNSCNIEGICCSRDANMLILESLPLAI